MEQKIEIDAFSGEEKLGTFTISCDTYLPIKKSKFIGANIRLTNVPIVEEMDNKTPIQFLENNLNGSKILLLEEKQYDVSFEFFSNKYNLSVFNSLLNDKSEYKPLNLINSPHKDLLVGNLNFKSYVGKTFIDIKENKETIFSIPIEVKSKKIDYNEEYSSMIGDLAKYSSGLEFYIKSPVFQNYILSNKSKESDYENFMILEYLFCPDNLPSTVEYLSGNLYSVLQNDVEEVPTSMATNIGPNELIDMFSNPDNLYKTQNSDSIWNKRTKGYIPIRAKEIEYVDNIDVPENRFYKNFLEQVNDLILNLLKKQRKGYIKDRLLEFQDEISYYLSLSYFKDISKMDYEPLNSQVLQKKEGYRDILEYFLMLELGFNLEWGDLYNDFKGYEKKLNKVYEYWVNFQLIEVLEKLTNSKVNFDDIFTIDFENKLNINLKEGTNLNFNYTYNGKNVNLTLFYNKSFNKSNKGSYSVDLRPDYTLLIKLGENKYYIHFDAKYKLNRDSFKNEDIKKMHTYKDAISNTLGAYVLYPGEDCEIYEEKEYIGVGAFPLSPRNNKNNKKELLDFIKGYIEYLIKIN